MSSTGLLVDVVRANQSGNLIDAKSSNSIDANETTPTDSNNQSLLANGILI